MTHPAPPNSAALSHRLLLFAWLGLLSGTAASARTWLWPGKSNAMFRNDHAVWMTPLAECLVFVIAGSVLWGLTCWLTPRRRMAVAVFGLGILSAATVASQYVHPFAVVLFGLGIAASLQRSIEQQPAGFRSILYWTTPLLLLFVGVSAASQFRRDAAPDAVTVAQPLAGSPNVLLIIWDTVRADSIDLRPGNRLTPNLAELARVGVAFERAIAPGTWTLPTHASLFTGKYPDQHGSSWHRPLEHGPTLAELYLRQGYATGGFVGNLYYCNRRSGLERGFQTYRDHTYSLSEILRHSHLVDQVARTNGGWSFLGVYDELGRKDGSQVIDEFTDWRRQQGDRPYFAFLNFYDAHDPYLPDRLLNGGRLTACQKLRLRRWRRQWPQELPPWTIELARSCYEAQIHVLDQYLGRLIDDLRRSGQLERTLIVVTSDHGEHFGEHQLFSHGNSVRRALSHVPLVIAYPGRVPQGHRERHPVSLCDVGRTLLDICDSPHADSFSGVTLASLWSGGPVAEGVRAALTTVDPHPRMTAFPHLCSGPVAREKQYAWLSGDWYLISKQDGTWHLYDFARDANEETDLSGRPEVAARWADRQGALHKVLAATLGSHPGDGSTTWLTGRSMDDQTRTEPPVGQEGGR